MSVKYRVSWKHQGAAQFKDCDTVPETEEVITNLPEGSDYIQVRQWVSEVIDGFQTTGPTEVTTDGDTFNYKIPVEVNVKAEEWKGEKPPERFTRVFTLDPRATPVQEVLDGLTMLLEGLKADMADKPDMYVRFETDPDLAPDAPDDADPENDLAKALEEQAETHDASTVAVNDFAKAVQTAMRKNGIKNCAWVVVIPAKDKETAPRFLTGGTERSHNWLRESLELSAAVRMQLAQNKATQEAGMKVLESGLAVPERPKLVIPT